MAGWLANSTQKQSALITSMIMVIFWDIVEEITTSRTSKDGQERTDIPMREAKLTPMLSSTQEKTSALAIHVNGRLAGNLIAAGWVQTLH